MSYITESSYDTSVRAGRKLRLARVRNSIHAKAYEAFTTRPRRHTRTKLQPSLLLVEPQDDDVNAPIEQAVRRRRIGDQRMPLGKTNRR